MLNEEQCRALGLDYQVYQEAAQVLFEKVFGPVLRAMHEAVEDLVKALRPFVDAFLAACREIYDAVRNEYVARGEIYGDTHEGLMRWFEEITTIARLRQQAEYIEQRHAMLTDIRAMRL